MRKLLEASSQRIIKILETLYLRDGWTTLSDLARSVGASERTVAADVAQIRRHWAAECHIEVSPKNGVYLQNRNIASLSHICSELFNRSVALQWIRELLFHPNHGMEFYENKLFVSRSTLLRQLPKINRALASRGMEIQSENNRFQFYGRDESYLRDFCTGFLLELYGLDLKQYDLDIEPSAVVKFILTLLNKYLDPEEFLWVREDDISILYYTMFYLVSLVRENQGYNIPSSYPVESEVPEEWLWYLKKHFPRIGMQNLRPIHDVLHRQCCGWDSKEEQEQVMRETELFFQRLQTAVSVSPTDKTQRLLRFILRALYRNAKLRVSKTSILFDRVYYFAFALKKANPFLYRTVEQNLQIFSHAVRHDMSDRLPDVLFWICLTLPELRESSRFQKILLISDFGKPHARFLAKRIIHYFNGKDSLILQIDIAPDVRSLDEQKAASYDVLITTVANLPLRHRQIVLINDYPSIQDFCSIHKALLSHPAKRPLK